MARHGVRLTVLGEDKGHEQFARYIFLALGFHRRELYFRTSPTARGSAEKWVRTQYAKEVRASRRKSSAQNVALVVVLDADQKTAKHRHNQLDKELEENGVPKRSPKEPIVIWIPKRHIETWVAYLSGSDVNETDDFKNRVSDEDWRPAARRFVEIYRDSAGLPDDLPDSLSKAYEELDRLPS